MSHDSNVNVLISLTILGINRGNKNNQDRLLITTEEGRSFLFYHSQDCCESVSIERIRGSLKKLEGQKIVDATEVISSENPRFYRVPEYTPESQTWTIVTLKTEKDVVEIRWHGTSNGYYSESVSFVETTKGQPEW